MKKLLLSMLALGAMALTSFSQTSYPVASYSPITVTLPVTTLAASTSTNYQNGWVNTTYYTNSSVTYSQTTGTFSTNTVITTNSATTLSQFYCGQQKDVGLEVDLQGSTNLVLTLARSIKSANPDTLNQFTFTATGTTTNANGYLVGVTNIPATFIAGCGYLYVVGINNAHANHTLTNLSVTCAVEKNAP